MFKRNLQISLAFKLAIANRRRLVVTLLGASLATALIVYQLFLIVGFVASATAIVRSIDADIWVTAKGSQSFDFAIPLRASYVQGLVGSTGVAAVEPVAAGFASSIDAAGRPAIVAIAGLPLSQFKGHFHDDSEPSQSNKFGFLDATSLKQFGVTRTPFNLEINQQQFVVSNIMHGYPTFLGSPFLVTSTETAKRLLLLPPAQITGAALWLKPDADLAATITQIEANYPELSVYSTTQFSQRSAIFWLTKTGAGGGLLLSAMLGFLIGFLIISQNLYASVLEAMQQYTTLRAIGIEKLTLRNIITIQATAIALTAALVGALLAFGMAHLTRAFVLGWIAQPLWVPIAVAFGCVLMGLFSSLSAIKLLHSVEPADALRQ